MIYLIIIVILISLAINSYIKNKAFKKKLGLIPNDLKDMYIDIILVNNMSRELKLYFYEHLKEINYIKDSINLPNDVKKYLTTKYNSINIINNKTDFFNLYYGIIKNNKRIEDSNNNI